MLEVALKQAIVILLSRHIRRLSKRANIQDQLLADFAAEQLAKVEIYSFAAAANHFSVPYTLVQPIKGKKADMSDGHVGASGEGDGKGPDDRKKRFVFGAVEHFANTRDYVSEIGESLIVFPMLQVLGLITGVLAFAPLPPPGTVPGQLPGVAAEGRFAGRIFKRVGTTGHLLLSH